MSSHIIVVFDRSSSMASGFSGGAPEPGFRGEHASLPTKILEAKAQLASWLRTSGHDKVTIVPFSSAVTPAKTFALPADILDVQKFLESIEANGGTNLAIALEAAISVGRHEDSKSFLRYLIVTDGLSDTIAMDHALVASLPGDQGVDAILIDPTTEGEAHVRSLCIRGRYIPVYGAPELRDALAERGAEYRLRGDMQERLSMVLKASGSLREQVLALSRKSTEFSEGGARARSMAQNLGSQLAEGIEAAGAMRKSLANADYPVARLKQQLSRLESLCREADQFVSQHAAGSGQDFRTSLARPRRLSKGYASFFLVQVFSPGSRRQAKKRIAQVFADGGVAETTTKSAVLEGHQVDIQLSSAEVEFSKPVKKVVEQGVTHALFFGKPKDQCRPGKHLGLLTISDTDTGHQYDSVPFDIDVVDYVFDHVSRPLLAKVAAGIAGLGSLASFTLAFLEQVDKSYGLASGTAAGFVAVFLVARVLAVYRNPTVTIASSGQESTGA